MRPPSLSSSLLVLAIWSECTFAQSTASSYAVDSRKPILVDFIALESIEPLPAASESRTPRLRFLGMPNGSETMIEADEDDSDPSSPGDVQVLHGMYNPYLDVRRPGDPRSSGFTKVFVHAPLMEAAGGRWSLGLQTLTPAGIDSGGFGSGPTIVSPTLMWFQDLGDGSALHGYFGQNIRANRHWRDRIDTGQQLGLAWQMPIPMLCDENQEGVYFFVQGLASYRDPLLGQQEPLIWEIAPGLHFRFSDQCWMSLAVSRYNILAWAWQY